MTLPQEFKLYLYSGLTPLVKPLASPHDHCAVPAGCEFRQVFLGNPAGGAGRRPVAAPGHHGRPFRAEHFVWTGSRPRVAAADKDVPGCPLDVFASGNSARTVRKGWRRPNDGACRVARPRDTAALENQVTRQEGR